MSGLETAQQNNAMKSLTVLYDAECGLCQSLRDWLSRQPKWFPVEFLPLQSPEVDRRWVGVRKWEPENEMLAIDDAGGIYQGEAAWITLLFALREYRELSLLLVQPAWRGMAKKAVELISQNRLNLSEFFGLNSQSV